MGCPCILRLMNASKRILWQGNVFIRVGHSVRGGGGGRGGHCMMSLPVWLPPMFFLWGGGGSLCRVTSPAIRKMVGTHPTEMLGGCIQ